MKRTTFQRLEALGLLERLDALAPEELERLQEAAGPGALLLFADAGVVEGALSVGFGVRPEELVGPLCMKMGGAARQLRVTDVRDRPEYELRVQTPGGEERWATPGIRDLVRNLNDLYRADPSVARVAVLGEWADAVQLWCVPTALLSKLEREDFFAPENRRELRADEE